MSRRRRNTAGATGEAPAGPLRGMGDGTFRRRSAEQERPYLAALSGKDRAYKAGRLKARGARRESERPEVPEKVRNITHWREGALL